MLNAAIDNEPDSLDPAKSNLYASLQVLNNVYDKLVNIDAAGNYVPQLATRWSTPEPLTWVFDLATGVKFHDGHPFTADDVKFTFDRMLDPKTAGSFAESFAAVKDIEVLSPTQVAFHLKTPFAPLLTNLADVGQIMSRTALDSGDPARQPIGTGPFKLTEWTQGQRIVLTRNPEYSDKTRPYLDQVVVHWPKVDEARVQALKAGELQWIDQAPPQEVTALKGDSQLRFVTGDNAGLPEFILFNVTAPPFDNKALRQAVEWAIDKEEIRQLVYSGQGQVGSEEVATGSKWYDGADPYQKGPDLDKARALMKEAGHEKGLTVKFDAYTAGPEPVKVGELLRSQLAKIGITVEVAPFEISVWISRLFKREYSFTLAFQEHSIDPDNFYSLVFKTGSGSNVTGYSSSQVDSLIEQGRAASSQTERASVYKQLRAVIFDDAPIVFLHYRTFTYFMQKNVLGSAVSSTLELDFKDMGLTSKN